MRRLSIQAHCSDCFSMNLCGKKYQGYVPPFLGGGGDDVELEIDLDTGQILDWSVPSKGVLETYFG